MLPILNADLTIENNFKMQLDTYQKWKLFSNQQTVIQNTLIRLKIKNVNKCMLKYIILKNLCIEKVYL